MSGLTEQERGMGRHPDQLLDWDLFFSAADVERIKADAEAATAERIAQGLAAMGPVWGGDAMWMTTGTKVADLTARLAREIGESA